MIWSDSPALRPAHQVTSGTQKNITWQWHHTPPHCAALYRLQVRPVHGLMLSLWKWLCPRKKKHPRNDYQMMSPCNLFGRSQGFSRMIRAWDDAMHVPRDTSWAQKVKSSWIFCLPEGRNLKQPPLHNEETRETRPKWRGLQRGLKSECKWW